MAKSLRSKWRRKCRAVKRVRYGQKELERLKKTLGIDDNNPSTSTDVQMSEIQEIATVKTAKDIKAKETENDTNTDASDIKKFNTKTLMDKNGAYPIWLHPRKIRGTSKKAKKQKKKGKGKSKNAVSK